MIQIRAALAAAGVLVVMWTGGAIRSDFLRCRYARPRILVMTKMTTKRLDALLQLSSGGGRICPVPVLCDRFWKLLGSPREDVGPPLILAGLAFSSDRDKRERFQAHIRYAGDHGLLDEAERFIPALKMQDWHSCSLSGLDWNHGEAIAEDQRKKDLEELIRSMVHLAASFGLASILEREFRGDPQS